jgi:predicted ribosomally synthesized peptide with SipW-like signal peptide
MRFLRSRALLVLFFSIACIFSIGTSSALASFNSTKAVANTFTTGSWGCKAGSATLSRANGSTVQDSYVDQASKTTNYGTINPLLVNVGPGNNKDKRLLVQFSPLPAIPAGCVFKTATLALYTSSAQAGLTYNIYNLSAAWVETVVNWNNQPGVVGNPVAVITTATIGPTPWNVTSLVGAQYSGAFNRGFIVEPAAGTGNSTNTYQSNESPTSSQRPGLTITWGP